VARQRVRRRRSDQVGKAKPPAWFPIHKPLSRRPVVNYLSRADDHGNQRFLRVFRGSLAVVFFVDFIGFPFRGLSFADNSTFGLRTGAPHRTAAVLSARPRFKSSRPRFSRHPQVFTAERTRL
jgi:hypothetical protein